MEDTQTCTEINREGQQEYQIIKVWKLDYLIRKIPPPYMSKKETMNAQAITSPTKHTPGPWITSTGHVPDIGRALGILKASHKPGEKDECICVVCKEDDTQPHDIANADLIAAAPDMLAALKAVVDAREDPEMGWIAADKVRDALAKASGNVRPEGWEVVQ